MSVSQLSVINKSVQSVSQNQRQEAQRATYRAPEYNLPPFLGQGGHFCLLISPNNTNLV